MLLYEAKSIACLWNQFQAVDKRGDDASYRKRKAADKKKKKVVLLEHVKSYWVHQREWEQLQPNHALAQM